MSKFNTTVTKTPSTTTFEGGRGHLRDVRSELFLLAVANMAGERTFYESAEDRDQRYADLDRKSVV